MTINKYIPEPLLEAIEFDRSYFGVRVDECGEELVNVREILEKLDLNTVFNDDLTATGQERLFYLRESLVPPLLSVINDLSKEGLFLRFEYLYRHLSDQRAAFRRSVRTFKEKLPDLGNEEILDIAGVFVAATPATAGHVSGAALDVTLIDEDMNAIDLGVDYIHPGPESITDSSLVSEDTRTNRRTLVEAMERYGFANYPYEYWHFSAGDKIATKIQGGDVARYGPVVFDPDTGQTSPVSNPEEMFEVGDILDGGEDLG